MFTFILSLLKQKLPKINRTFVWLQHKIEDTNSCNQMVEKLLAAFSQLGNLNILEAMQPIR